MWALLPLKEFASAKQRLSGLLSPTERSGLLDAMANDVLQVLSQHPDIDGTLVVSDDPAARRLAQRHGVDWMGESTLGAKGLNPAVQAGVACFAAQGIADAMIIHGDLPLVTSAEITHLIGQHRISAQRAVTIATDRHGTGTNALLCSTRSGLIFGYGPASCHWHQMQAQALDMRCDVIALPGICCDIDAPEDLLAFLNHASSAAGLATRDYLATSGIARQLLTPESA